MKDESFKGYIITMILVGVFILAIFSFIGIRINYDSESKIDDSQFNITAMEEQINKTNTDSKKWEEKFRSDDVVESTSGLILFSIWSIGGLIWSNVFGIIYPILDGIGNILNIPAYAVGAIISIIIISLLFALWRVISQGE